MTQNPLLGTTGPHPWDTDQSHALIYSIPATYYNADCIAELWEGGSNKGRAYYDTQFALGCKCNQIWTIDFPIDEIATLLPPLLDRYDLWAVGYREEADWQKVAAAYAAISAAAPLQRVIGPNYWEGVHPTFYEQMIPTIQKLDVLSWHEYKAARMRGNAGQTPWPNDAQHVWQKDNPWPSRPDLILNLQGRIRRLKSYTKFLRGGFDGPQLIATEYGIDCENEGDAWAAAMVFRAEQVPVCLWTPHSPMNRGINSVPYGNGDYADGKAKWSQPMQCFLEAMNG